MQALTKVFTDAGYIHLHLSPILLATYIELEGEDTPIINRRQLNDIAHSSTYAEYQALIYAMKYCVRMEYLKCHFFCDNLNVVNRVRWQHSPDNPQLRPLWNEVNALWEEFEIAKISHISGKLNKAHKYVEEQKK